ncbi:MAG TPA: DUF6036 family nucleotidyltransferase [Gemmataceae bacterium]|jgi:hypothetical protein
MNDQIRTFFDRLDQELLPFAKEEARLDMCLLGRAALVVNYQLSLSTKDIDKVWMRDSELERKAIELLGNGSTLAKTLGLDLDPVPQALPPIPNWFRRRCGRIRGDWKVLRLWMLEVHDLAATKLKSFRPKDREDLQILCDRGLLDPAKLQESLTAAFPFKSPKVEDVEDDPDTPDWARALANLKRLQSYLRGSIASI